MGPSASRQLLVIVGRAVTIFIIAMLAAMSVHHGQQGEWPVTAAAATIAALFAAELYLPRGGRS